MVRKLAMLMSVFMMVFALAACGASKGSSSSSNGAKKKTSQSAAQSKTGNKTQSSNPSSSKGSPKTKGLVNKDKTVAVVNGEKITGKQYNPVLQQIEAGYQQQGQDPTTKKVYKQAKQQAINSVVGQKLILQDAKKKGYQPSDKKVTQQLNQMETQYGGKKKLKQLLKKQNMTIDQFKKNVSRQIEMNTYIAKEAPVKVTDQDIQQAYNQYKSSTKKPQKLSAIKSSIKQQLKQQKLQPKIANIVSKLKKQGNVKVKI